MLLKCEVKQNGFALKYASEELRKDPDVVLEAMEQDARAVQFASKEFRGDKEIVLEALKLLDPLSWQCWFQAFRALISAAAFCAAPLKMTEDSRFPCKFKPSLGRTWDQRTTNNDQHDQAQDFKLSLDSAPASVLHGNQPLGCLALVAGQADLPGDWQEGPASHFAAPMLAVNLSQMFTGGFSPNSVATLKGFLRQGLKARCLIEVGGLVCGIFLVDYRT